MAGQNEQLTWTERGGTTVAENGHAEKAFAGRLLPANEWLRQGRDRNALVVESQA